MYGMDPEEAIKKGAGDATAKSESHGELTVDDMLIAAGEMDEFGMAIRGGDRTRMMAALVRSKVPQSEAENLWP